MKTITLQLTVGAALLIGVAVGYFMRGESIPQSEPHRKVQATKGKIDDIGVRREKITTFENVVVTNVISVTNQFAFPGGPRRGDPKQWMEELKKNDPKRFNEMTNRFAKMRAMRAERSRSRREFLASVDTSKMSASAKKTHNELQELLERREELEAQLHQENLTDDKRHELMDEMRELNQQSRKLNSQERSNLFEETARSLGFEGDDLKEITATLNDVVEATESGRMGPPGPPPSNGAGPR